MLLPSVFGNDFFEDFMNFPAFGRPGREAHRNFRRLAHGFNGLEGLMRTDVRENETGYEIHMDLPGFKKEDIQVSLKDGYLTVEASRSQDSEEGWHFLRQERYVGQLSRSFFVGDLLTEEDVKASFRHGVLTLFLPKKEEVPRVEEKRPIAIEG